jgi:hypothetical protein
MMMEFEADNAIQANDSHKSSITFKLSQDTPAFENSGNSKDMNALAELC